MAERRTLRIEIAPATIALVVGVLLAFWLLGQLTSVLMVVTVALILVGTLDPAVGWFERHGFGRGRALVVVFTAVALVFAGIVFLMVPPLVAEVIQLVEHAPAERDQLAATLDQRGWGHPIANALRDLPVDGLGARAATAAIGYSRQLLEMIGYGLSSVFIAIYLLADPVRARGVLYALTPRRHHVKLASILLELKKIVGGYVRGQLITSAAITVFVFAILTILQVPNALAISLFAGLTDVIPFIGGYIASAPVILAVASRGLTLTIGVLLLMILYQEFESRILVPRIYGRALRLSPAIVVVALLVGGTLAGIFGALISLPIAAALQMLLRELRVDLPGEAPATAEAHAIDERATTVYAELTRGVGAAKASSVAENLASIVKKTEPQG